MAKENKKGVAEPEESLDEIKKRIIGYIDEDKAYFEVNYKDKLISYRNQYLGKREKTSGTQDWRAIIHVPISFEECQEAMATQVAGLLGNDGNFFIIPPEKKGDGQSLKDARGMEVVAKHYLKKGKFVKTISDSCLNGNIGGWGWFGLDWKYEKGTLNYYDEKDGKLGEVKKDHIFFDCPIFPTYDSQQVYAYKHAKTMEDCRRITITSKITLGEARIEKERKRFNRKDELNRFISDKEALINKKEVDVYLPYEMTITKERNYQTIIIDGDYVVQRINNPAKSNSLNMFPIVKYPEPNRLYGQGICEIIQDLQEELNENECMKLDNMKLGTNKIFTKRDTFSLKPSQRKWYPGIVLDVEEQGDIAELMTSPLSMDAFRETQDLIAMVSRTTGSASGVTSPDNIAPVNNKTATGARLMKEKENERAALYFMYNREVAMYPFVESLLSLIQQHKGGEKVEDIIGKEKAEFYDVTGVKIDKERKYDFILLGESGLLDKEMELQNMGAFLEFLQALGPEAAQMLNIPAFIKKLGTVLDIPDELLRTDSEQPPVPEQPQQAQAQKQLPQSMAELPPNIQEQLQFVAQTLGKDPNAILQAVNDGTVTMEQVILEAQKVVQGQGQPQGGVR